MKADAHTEAEIKALVDDIWKEYARKNLEGCMRYWTSDPDLVAIGTGADELRLGPDELKHSLERDFQQAEDIEITMAWLRLSAAGNVAWSAANVQMSATVDNQRTTLPCRLTNVFEKRDGTWRIMLLHLSLPATEQESGQSWPTS
jgi:ketosteroid isomerase-like protein